MKNRKKNSNASLIKRIYFCLLGVAFASVLLFGFFWFERTISNYHNEVKLIKQAYIETKKLEIKNKILGIKDYIQWMQDSPLSPLYHASASIDSDEIYENVLQFFLLDSISKLRYAENEYIFVNTFDGKALVTNGHYNQTPVDIPKSDDTLWNSIFKVQQSAAFQPGGVYYTYTWPKLSPPDKSVKTSYFSYYPKWKWIIGTGFYEDDIDVVINQKRNELLSELRKSIFSITFFLLISSLVCYLLVRFFSKQIGRNIILFKSFFEKAGTENQFIDVSQVYYQEFAFMAEAANKMVEGRRHVEEKILNLNLNLERIVEERTAQLELTNQELESFSYSISHDLRAPLRAINGFSQILANRHRTSLNDEGKQYLNFIVEASIRMEKLINDLLGHSKLGRQSPVMGVLSLSDVIKSVCSDFEQQLKDINAQFIPEEEMPQIIGDETLLRQIFSNLIGNAITYRRIEMPLIIRISAGINAGNLIIKVTDNGIGILQEYWEKIFDVFLRLHHDDAYAGTGIGLATVKKAVTLLGGTVWVESVVGEGSTFFISIPQNSKPGNKLIN